MTPECLDYLCDPVYKKPLRLINEEIDGNGMILSGDLVTEKGSIYKIKNGVPRFIDSDSLSNSVESFGNEWNYFNFTDFKVNWLNHTVKNTFGSTKVFKGKVVVDAGGGSGAQSLWMLESGAKHVIMLELSNSVDDVVNRNIDTKKWRNFDVIQCSIDSPPIKDLTITGIVYCHNVIQHTPSVENTAKALFKLVAEGGEFVFNCYPLNDKGLFRWIRFHCIYKPLRKVLSSQSFNVVLLYSKLFGVLRLVPFLGLLLEKLNFCIQGDVPVIQGESFWTHLRRRFNATVLNTFDSYGSHTYQHHKSDEEIRRLVETLQPDQSKIKNSFEYFSRPAPIGCALRIFR